ncbi:MAG: hypothetical protein LC775_06405, partial [Acidobacteria bacterium]|nr:hypothetical protein [Acidobacteriota bacterium]
MRIPCKAIRTSALFVMALAAFDATNGQKKLGHAPASLVSVTEGSPQVRLKLADGSFIAADEVSESEQGIWYRKGGVSHLISRERVKGIERGSTSKPKADVQIAKLVLTEEKVPSDGSALPTDQSVWIYLIGGARVEADSVTESAAGVWYRRGPLTIFVERARIDHIERGELETASESDSSSKKARGWTTGNR